MFSFLRQPYPFAADSPRRALLVSVLVGAFIAFFLIAFKPFDTQGSRIPQLNLFLAGYGLVAGLSILLPLLVFPRLFPRAFSEEHWTVGRQIMFQLCIVAVAISVSYFYLLLAGGVPRMREYLYFFRNGLLVATIPVVLITLLDYIRKLRYYERGARVMPARTGVVSSSPARAKSIVFIDDKDRPELTVAADRIWCLHSDGNYVEVWTATPDGDYERTLIRNTLAKLAEQLPAEEFLLCHRSWIVRPALIEEVTGNAQGYRLHRAGAPVVAVARGRSKEVLAALEEPN